MFDNTLSDEQKMMVDTARRLVRQHIVDSRMDMQLDRSGEFPHAVYKTLWENGVTNLEFPESVGGAGLSCLDHVIVQEEVHYGCLGIGTSVATNNLAAMPLILVNNESLNKKYLSLLIDEPKYAAYGCSEPDAGSDVAGLTTKYVKKGDKFLITGQKRWITNGDQASWYVIFAREEGTKGHRGIAAFVVDADAPGARWDSLIHKLGQRASHTCDLIFEDCEVPAQNMLAGPEHGFRLAMATFDRSRPWIASAACGVIRRARDESLKYATERKTFGTPIIITIAQSQAIKRCHHLTNIDFQMMSVPQEFPDKSFDLIVLSEVGYYWCREDLEKAQNLMLDRLKPQGHLLLVHWIVDARVLPLTGHQVHDTFLELVPTRLKQLKSLCTTEYRLDLFEKI